MAEYHITAESVLGETAVVAYSARRSKGGPNGEWQTAFLLRTKDRGATWTEIPLTRDAWGFFYYPGFPVWPPEYVSSVQAGSETVIITFRDEEVLFEPGGESLWGGTLSPRGVWKIRRIRRMHYAPSFDDWRAPPALDLQLAVGFSPPGEAVVRRAAARAAAYFAVGVPNWLWWFPGLAAGVLFGAGAFVTAAALLGASIIALPLSLFLLDRRRQRHAAS